jgi:hypothetical protein
MRRFVVVALAFTFVASVLHADDRRPQTPAAAASQAADGFPAVGGAPIIKMVSTGAAPKTALRYAVPAGSKSRTAMDTEMAMTMEMMGMSMPEMKMPTMKMVMDMEITAVAANGDMSFTSGVSSMTYDTAGADPAMAAALAGASTDLSSLKTSGTMTSRGVTTSSLDISKIADPALKQMMESASTAVQSMSFPMPEEAVGVGARWEVRQRMASGGIEALTTSTVEVTAIQGSKVSLKVTLNQTAPVQAMKNPALPPDAEINLTSFTGTGTTNTVVDLATLSTEGTGAMSMAMSMQMKMQGMEQNMNMTTNLKIKTSPVK